MTSFQSTRGGVLIFFAVHKNYTVKNTHHLIVLLVKCCKPMQGDMFGTSDSRLKLLENLLVFQFCISKIPPET